MIDKKKCFIFGYGYTADYLRKMLLGSGWEVVVTSRQKHTQFADKDFVIDYSDAAIVEHELADSTHLVSTVPPDDSGDVIFKDFPDFDKLTANIYSTHYISATSVYGNHDGNIIDENIEVATKNGGDQGRIEAEHQWDSYAKRNNFPLNIYRLSAIYGPGRSALDRVKSQKISVHKKGHLFSRIHIEDITNILCVALVENKNESRVYSKEIYNLADDYPATISEVNNYACKLLDLPPLQVIDYDDANLNPRMRKFFASNKKIDNQKVKKAFKLKLKYPDYKTGLKSCLRLMHSF